MNRFGSLFKPLMWLMALLLTAFVAGCGGGGGGDGTAPPPTTPAPVLPGAVGQTNPTVSSSNPSHLATNVPTTTNGPGDVVTGKTVTATFTQAMAPLTINSAVPGARLTFTLKETAGANVPGTVVLNGLGTTATFTPTAPLNPGIEHTATVTTAATNTLGTPMPNAVSWRFTTGGAAAPAGQAPLDLGVAGPFAIFTGANAEVSLALGGGAQVASLVNGNIGITPDLGVGVCTNCRLGPALPITVVGEIHIGDAQANAALAALIAAFADGSTRSTNACTLANPTDLTVDQGACVGYPINPGIGSVYKPGLYRTAISIGLAGGEIFLDGGGNPDAVFIFQTDDAITTGVNSTVTLQGLAKAKNVFWVSGAAATLSLNTVFKGTVISTPAAVSVGVGSTIVRPTVVEGRVLSLGAAATVGEFTTITVPQ